MLVFATNNINKLQEARQILPFPVMSLGDFNLMGDIPETADTLQGNALQKAMFVAEKLDNKEIGIFADDTGLEVKALNGEPSVFSARYANFPSDTRITALSPTKKKHYAALPDPPFHLNIKKLLAALKPFKTPQERAACFKTVICLLHNGSIHYFEGRVNGYILYKPQGKRGFGYDSIFCPDGYEKSFASLTAEEKNKISHRGDALRKMRMLYE
ncbi:MAG: RdgB/HAM1 family non-canonical purine NTP pyrophosphatase [Bacteroidales bacterium]|jgi:XTP/dITP diphosphohydrolase|nr:RdgB/HAM1 family non-canonical purine NTP pyrophosphatase [Bacteroidales bacterium]